MGLIPEGISILPPSDDRIFKLLLTAPEAEPVLIDIISAILSKQVSSVRIRNSELPVNDINEKAERFDVNCYIEDGSQIDIEMQATRMEERKGNHQNLKNRSIYYLSDLHSSQSSKGSIYDELVKSYQVTFCSYTVFPEKENFINSYSFRHNLDYDLLSDTIRIIYVELSKLDSIATKPVEKMSDLEKWAIFLNYANIPDYRNVVNQIIETKEVFTVAGDLLMSVSQDDRERAIFRSRRMYQSDLESNMLTARRNGREEGREKRNIEIVQYALNNNKSIEDIVAVTGLSYGEVERLVKIIEKSM